MASRNWSTFTGGPSVRESEDLPAIEQFRFTGLRWPDAIGLSCLSAEPSRERAVGGWMYSAARTSALIGTAKHWLAGLRYSFSSATAITPRSVVLEQDSVRPHSRIGAIRREVQSYATSSPRVGCPQT